MNYLLQGGWVMFAILLASIIALAVFFERLFYLHSVIKNANTIKQEIDKFRGLKISDAISICNHNPGTASNIIKAGLQSSRSREEMERSMEDEAKYRGRLTCTVYVGCQLGQSTHSTHTSARRL